MKKSFLLFVGFILPLFIHAQDHFTDRPKLVVGIVVDQMRMEYLYRFYNKFGDGGFKRLINSGFYLSDAEFNYVPTYTGPGHTSIYTGSTPAIHGIIANEWYDKELDRMVNCVEDPNQKLVGSAQAGTLKGVPEAGKFTEGGDVSPWRNLSTTVTDELKLATQKKAKVVGVSIKDRAAVLPAGHMPDGAYWFDSNTGTFITSTYYMDALPSWVTTFNSKDLSDALAAKGWQPLLPLDQYTESGPDASPYETPILGKTQDVFPYVIKKGDYDAFLHTPFANDYLEEFAKAAIAGEQMGKDDVTDFLCISFSSTDIIGHAVGPEAVEIEDTYLRLDKDIADLMKTLDSTVGQGQYTLFLTADHGVDEVPQYLIDNKLPAGYMTEDLKTGLNQYLAPYFKGQDMIKSVSNDQVFLDHSRFPSDVPRAGIDLLIASDLVGQYLMGVDGVANYFTKDEMHKSDYGEESVKGAVIRGFNMKRSGDVAYLLQPGWLADNSKTGTSHGSPYAYDTNVPVLFYGWGIKQGTTATYHPITDIAPTISVLLKIKYPSGCTGHPITELLQQE